MQSLFLTQQIIGAVRSASSYAWGFDAGINLNIDTVLEKADIYATSSIASNISGKNINLISDNKTNIQGSSVTATNDININAKEVNVVASRDKSSEDRRNEHKNLNINYSIFSGLTTTASYDRTKSKDATTNYTNSKVNAKNINITSKEDTNIKGANVSAEEKVVLDIEKDLNVVAVQNRKRSDSKTMGINFSLSNGSSSKNSGTSGSTGFSNENSGDMILN